MDKFKHNARRGTLAVSVALVTLLTAAPAAFATVPDPGGTGEAMSQIGDGAESWVGTYAVPVIVALLLVGIGLALLIRFGKKARSIV